MSNVIKSQNVTRSDNPRVIGQQASGYITIQIPVIDNGATSEFMRKKMLEELDELLAEFATGPVRTKEALAETLDVVQVMMGYILAVTKESILGGEAAHDYVESYVDLGNQNHILKIHNYAEHRGWKVIAGGIEI